MQDEWQKSARIRKEIELDAFVVMPNHVHGIDVITEARAGDQPSLLHSGPTKRSLGAFVAGFKSAVTKGIGGLHGNTCTAIWQRNYFEHIIRNDESLTRVRQYIVDNSARWEFDRENPFATRLEAKDSWRNGR